jgi:hypothetical protein
MQPEDMPDSPQIATAITLGKALIEALGLDPKARIARIQIDLQACEVARVVVTHLMTQHQGLAVCEVLQQGYALVPDDTKARPQILKIDENTPRHPE